MAKDKKHEDTGEAAGEQSEEKAVSLVAQAFAGSRVLALPDSDPQRIQADIVGRVLSAETLDEMFDVWEAATIDKLEGKVLTVDDVDWGVFTSDEGTVPLARITCTVDGNDTPQVVIATSPNITAFLGNAVRIGALPFTARVVGSRTARGYTALRFGRP